jgi:RND family efflux transporter MFP subunit
MIGRYLGQALAVLAVTAVAIVIWALWLPASHPFLDRIGLLTPMERMGLPVARRAGDGVGEGSGGFGGGMAGGFGGGGAVTVITDEVAQVPLRDRVSAIGTGAALRSVVLMPEVSGRIVEIAVEPGAWVEAGTVVARLDDEAEGIARDRALLILDEAQDTAERLERLRASGTATAVQIREAELAVRNAELSLREAEFNLERRAIRAPIDGWIGLIDAEVGDQVGTATRIARIDDRSILLVDFRVPERLVGRIRPGDSLSVAPLARRDHPLEGRVRAVDSRVDEAGRNLRIQAEIANDADALRAGMAFAIEMEFEGETHPAVDPLAIQWTNEGAFVWMVRDGRAERVPVRILQRANGQVLVAGALAPGEQVVLEGVQSLRDGAEVAPRARGERPGDRSERAIQARAEPEPSET